MKAFATAALVLTLCVVGSRDGWSPGPADLKAHYGNSGATGEGHITPPKSVPWYTSPFNPENMTRAQRQQILSRERAAGRITNDQEKANFLATGNPHKTLIIPERKPLVRAPGMSDATWQRILATRPKQETYVQGRFNEGPGERHLEVEHEALRRGWKVIQTPGAPKNSGPPVNTTTSASKSNGAFKTTAPTTPTLYKPVQSLGVKPTPPSPSPKPQGFAR